MCFCVFLLYPAGFYLAHRGQLILSGDPYITPTLAVASILANLGMDLLTISAALLHDGLEDTDVSYDELKKEFGEMPTAEIACQFLESRDWKFEEGRTEQHVFRALVAHLKMLTGNEVNIADWSSATQAILN